MPRWVKTLLTKSGVWLSENSLNRHLATLPLGVLFTTWVLLCITGEGTRWWSEREALTTAGQAVPFGAVLYSSSVVLLDGGVKVVFYAMAQRKEEIDRRKQEGRRQLLKELIEQGVQLPPELEKEAEELGVLDQPLTTR